MLTNKYHGHEEIYIFYAFKEFTVKIIIPGDDCSIRSINKA